MLIFYFNNSSSSLNSSTLKKRKIFTEIFLYFQEQYQIIIFLKSQLKPKQTND
jgi:hypothetical protein